MIDLPKANYIEWNVKSVIKLNERDTYAYRGRPELSGRHKYYTAKIGI